MTTSGTLSNTGALVIGGAGGFGRACATRLARDGAPVTLMGRTTTTLRRVAAEIGEEVPGAIVDWIVGDATSSADVVSAVERADRFRLGICVATVGGGSVRPVLMLDEDTLRHDIDRNVISALLAIRHGASAMAAHGGGSIVCLSSSAAGSPFPFMPSYSVAKAALEALVRVAANELGHLGVRVNAVRPGLVPTHAEKPALLVTDPEQRAAVLAEKPLARVGTAEDIAEAVRYLAGPESSWVTGAVLPVEGGSHLRRAPYLEALARALCGDEAIDAAMSGRIPR